MPDTNTPNVIVDFLVDAEMVFLSIKNWSDYPAINVRIKPSDSIMGLGGRKDITDLSVFNEIKYLAPYKEIKIFIDEYHSFFENLKTPEIDFAVYYSDENGQAFRKKILHDLNIYKDLIFFIKKT